MLERPALYPWNEPAVSQLKLLWDKGISCSVIARELGPGFTKNSVIGKAHRLKLRPKGVMMSKKQKSALGRIGAEHMRATRKPNGKGQPKPQAIAARLAGPAFESAPLPEEDVGNDVTHLIGIMDLKAHDCRWISGDPLNVHGYCGKRAKEDSSYCAEHHARVYMGISR